MTRKLTEQRLVFASHNRGKFDEFAALFAGRPVELLFASDLHLAEPAETETTFAANARLKAQAAAEASGLPALGDDSGLEVDALHGAPGVYTADWAAVDAPVQRDFGKAMRLVHERLEAVHAPEPRTARFRCALALAWPDGGEELFEGTMAGRCVWPLRGAHGHGYDQMFQPEGYAITYAEMDPAAKNRISHRAVAFARLAAACLD